MWKLPWQACSPTHYSLMSIAQNNHWFSVSFTILVYAEFYADTHGVLIELYSVDFFSKFWNLNLIQKNFILQAMLLFFVWLSVYFFPQMYILMQQRSEFLSVATIVCFDFTNNIICSIGRVSYCCIYEFFYRRIILFMKISLLQKILS